MSAVGKSVGNRVGKRVGKTLGRSGSPIASYLPFINGLFPLWHAASTTPNADGLISAIADASTGLYPLSQGTPANQWTRGSGYIATADTTDRMTSTDAALLAMGDLTSHDACLFLACTVGATQAGSRTLAGWNNASTGNRAEVSAADFLRLRKEATVANSATDIVDTTIKSIIVHWASGAEGDAFGYVSGSLVQTLAVTGSATTAPTSFELGGVTSSAVDTRVVAAAVMDRAPTAGERAQWDAYVAAGCPL